VWCDDPPEDRVISIVAGCLANHDRAHSPLVKYYGPMDRSLFEQECAEVFEETFKHFPLSHIFFHDLDRGKSDSVTKLWQKLLTEFPIDKKCATFEFLVRVIQSVQTMSVNTVNEHTSYMSKVNEVKKTLAQVTFTVQEVMFLMEMTNFLKSDDKVHKKIWGSTEDMFDEAGDNDIPIDEIRKKNIALCQTC
jgi:hypothetical protein